MPFQELLVDNRVRLTPSQGRIMQYIVDNYEEAIFLTASQLAHSVGVSEATVVRLAQALGFDGYPGMQRKFREGLQNRLSTVTRLEHTVDHVGQVGDVVVKVLQEDIQNLSQTLRNLPIEVFEQAVTDIEKAKRIFVVGLRGAHAPALTLATYLRFLGKYHCGGLGERPEPAGQGGSNHGFSSFALSPPRPLGANSGVSAGLLYRVVHSCYQPDQCTAHSHEHPEARQDVAHLARARSNLGGKGSLHL